jgi:hypothetical protein
VTLTDVLVEVDMFLEHADGLKVVIEYDRDLHRVGPNGNPNGTTFWRNQLLRAAGYILITVSEQEWSACAGNDEAKWAMVAAKLVQAGCL